MPMSTVSEPAQEAVGPKAKIFISYSRKDMTFADRLETALKGRGFEPLIDRTEIYAFEDWWKRIESLIVKADTIIFVLSPDAVASEICAKEVDFAASLNKRFAPIVCRRVGDSTVPEALRRLHFIFFDDPAHFERSADDLAAALKTDIDWIRQHTEFGEQARRWAAAGRPGPRGLLLRSPVLEEAERWIASRPHGAPAPTEETQAYVAESRRGANRRRNILTGSLAAGLLVALALAGLAYWQRGIAVEERNVAESSRIGSLAALATSERLRNNWDTALRLGVHVARLALASGNERAEISAPREALATAVWQSDLRLTLSTSRERLNSAAFSPDGTRVVTASSGDGARIWDAKTGKEIAILGEVNGQVKSATFSPDGTRVITATSILGAVIWDAETGKYIMQLGESLGDHQDSVERAKALRAVPTKAFREALTSRYRSLKIEGGAVFYTLALANRGGDLLGRVHINSAQCPLRSESDRLVALPRSDAMGPGADSCTAAKIRSSDGITGSGKRCR